jgi:hypothetical protein
MQLAQNIGAPWLVWIGLSVIGLLAAAALHRLDRAGRLQPTPAAVFTES